MPKCTPSLRSTYDLSSCFPFLSQSDYAPRLSGSFHLRPQIFFCACVVLSCVARRKTSDKPRDVRHRRGSSPITQPGARSTSQIPAHQPPVLSLPLRFSCMSNQRHVVLSFHLHLRNRPRQRVTALRPIERLDSTTSTRIRIANNAITDTVLQA
jgi:hypothetical protein